MNKYHRGSDIESIITISGGAISLYHNVYVMVVNQFGNVIKHLSLSDEVGFESDDISVEDDANGKIKVIIRRDETEILEIGKYYYQVRVATTANGFTDSIRKESNSILGFKIVSDIEKVTDGVELDLAIGSMVRLEATGQSLSSTTPLVVNYSELNVIVPSVQVYVDGRVTNFDIDIDKTLKEVTISTSSGVYIGNVDYRIV